MIKIILCVKPVREKYIKNNTDDKWCINPYDLYALKCALSLKAIANIHITCISMGPDESVWNAIHIGADINLCGNLGSKTKVIDLEDAFPKRTPVVIDGNCEDIAYMIYEKIKEQEKS